jgi:hypothetical protein
METTDEQPRQLKTTDKTTYMREYKRKQYKENGNAIKEKNKAYYYKYKFNASTDDLRKYDVLLPIVIRIRKELDDLKVKNPNIIKEILEPYYLNI